MLKMAAFTVAIAFTASSAARADELTIVNKFQWPVEMRFDPIKLAAPSLPPPSLGDQMVSAYQNMPLRPTYVPASDANAHGAFSLQFRRAF
jgi:hypothetical protein